LAVVTAQAIAGKKSAIALLERMTHDDQLLERPAYRRRLLPHPLPRAKRLNAPFH
jgi:hypothetical protein